MKKVRIVVVLHEGSGEPVGVEGVSEFLVACDEPFGCLLVGISVESWVGQSSVAEEGFHGFGAERTGSCGGDLFGGTLDDVIRDIFGQMECVALVSMVMTSACPD